MTAKAVKAELAELADPDKAAFYPRFFKAFPGGYGEGDQFVGVVVPKQRQVARRHRDLAPAQVAILLRSPYHEHRHTALLILVEQYSRAGRGKADPDQAAQRRAAIFAFVRQHLDRIDNWDMVDLVAPKIIGPEAMAHPEHIELLREYARAESLWRRRIAMIATLAFIRADEYGLTLEMAETLVADQHDLIHKAVGWMLREVGIRDRGVEEAFLDRHAGHMPRTMLRYALEKFPKERRQHYMARP
ncbi:MAG: DNA alkylation repair protein [Myxococcota bacterium]